MEQNEDVIEGCPQLIRERFQFDVISHHRKNVLLGYDQSFTGQPDDVVVKLSYGLCVACRVQPAKFPCSEKLPRQQY